MHNTYTLIVGKSIKILLMTLQAHQVLCSVPPNPVEAAAAAPIPTTYQHIIGRSVLTDQTVYAASVSSHYLSVKTMTT